MKGELKRKALMKRNNKKLGKNLSIRVQQLLRKGEQQTCSQGSKERRKKFKLIILQFHSLKDCRRQGLKNSSLNS